MKKPWPELIMTVRMGPRTNRPAIMVYPDLLRQEPIGGDHLLNLLIDKWNSMAWVRNGQDWYSDVHAMFFQFKRAWTEKHQQYYFGELKKCLGRTLPEELLWLIAGEAQAAEWSSGIHVRTAENVTIIQQPSGPYPRYVDRHHFFSRRCCHLVALFMTFILACHRHDQVLGKTENDWLRVWIERMFNEVRWVHIADDDLDLKACPICANDYQSLFYPITSDFAEFNAEYSESDE